MAKAATTREALPLPAEDTTTETLATEAPPASLPSRATFEAARRVVEAVIIAAATSTGLYLVGSVYTDAYYGRMSIEATALDLTPPFIALQAVHVLQSLLEYPLLLLVLFLVYRAVTTRLPQVRSWADRLRQRFGRVALLVANALIVSPLILAAINAGDDAALKRTGSALSEVAETMEVLGIALLGYVLWLSLGPRELLLAKLQQRALTPIVLLFVLYLLDALVATAHEAARDAELLMTGASESSVAVSFTTASGVQPLPGADLLLVTIRNGHYFVVERQPHPPSLRPIAYAIPVRAVDDVRMQRVNAAAPPSPGFEIYLFATPTPP